MGSTVITVAPTGAEADKTDVPALPVTLAELVATARHCAAVGASVVHVHVRDAEARPTLEHGRLREAVATLRQVTDLIVQLSTGGAVTDSEADRLAVLDAEPDTASCTMGTVDVGHSLHRLLDRHGLPYGGHVHADLVTGVPGGRPGTTGAMVAALAELPAGATFSATGAGRTTLPVALALSAGGHLRVGMQDTLSYAPGRPVESNAQLVARAAGLPGWPSCHRWRWGTSGGCSASGTLPVRPSRADGGRYRFLDDETKGNR
jgi:uncharacterized protein (DUF849 family)